MASLNGVQLVKGTNNGSLDVYVQDQTTPVVNLFFHSHVLETTLSADTLTDDESLTLTSTAGISGGMIITIFNQDEFYQSFIKGITGNDVEIGVPLDVAFSEGSDVHIGEGNLNLDGSSSEIIASVDVPTNLAFDVYTLNFVLVCTATPAIDLFGDQTILTKGCYLRIKDGVTRNILYATSNISFQEYGFSVEIIPKAGGGTNNYVVCRKNIRDINGVAYRLKGTNVGGINDSMDFHIRDNLTGLAGFYISMNGHVVE